MKLRPASEVINEWRTGREIIPTEQMVEAAQLSAAEQMREAAAKLVEEAGCSCDGIVHYDDCPKYSIAPAIRSIPIEKGEWR